MDTSSEHVTFVTTRMATKRAEPRGAHQPRDLHLAGEGVDVAVCFEWHDAGEITLAPDGRVVFPSLPPDPGVYRFTFVPLHADARPRVYIGESDSLARRAGNYRSPGPNQPTNVRLNAAFVNHLRAGGAVRVAIACEVTMTSDGTSRALDLSRKPGRLLAENAALVLAQSAGDVDIENL